MRARGLALAALGLTATPGPAGAAPPHIVDARVQERSAAGGLRRVVSEIQAAEAGPAWIGYAVPSEGEHTLCCWRDLDSLGHVSSPGCRLESGGPFTYRSTEAAGVAGGTVRLEGGGQFLVLLRTEGRSADRIRTLSWGCGIDAGGLPLYWLSDVSPAESVRFLSEQLGDGQAANRPVVDGALAALALHAEPSATDALIRLARRDADARLRGQALFWLAQKAGRRATETIAAAVDEDPESQVRQRAVFALSQLPREEGVPRLIALARSHRDARVRRKAMFWLGQSDDPRALAFFEEVLRR